MSPVTAACPSCGAAVEFRYDDSFVRVCSYCNAVVGRSDRGFHALGRMGDLAATQSPLALFAAGRLGQTRFELVGRAQIAHARGGGWEEWYARFENGSWGWLSEAQGRYQLSFATWAPPGLPAFHSLWPGQAFTLELPDRVPETFTVTEVGEATYRAAAGELPYQLVAGMRFRYADLSGHRGNTATVDAGVDAGDQIAFFVGREVSLGELAIVAPPGGGPMPGEPAGPKVSAVHVACAQCGGSLELRAPDSCLRVTCQYCGALLDVNQGNLSYLRMLEPETQMVRPEIPLGSTVELDGPALTVIGCLRRSVHVDGIDYPFTEYLLYHQQSGYRWLVDSDGQWNYVTPLSAGEVSTSVMGRARHGKHSFRHFQSAEARVDGIFGEFTWKVELGERVSMSDYVSPPLMLSSEATSNEINWSLGVWMDARELSRRIRPPGAEPGSLTLPRSSGVAPNQPFAHRGILALTALLSLVAIAVAVALAARSPNRSVALVFDPPLDSPVLPATPDPGQPRPDAGPWDVPPIDIPRHPHDPFGPSSTSPDGPPASRVHFSQPIELAGGQNLAFQFSTSLDNSWLYIAADLVDEASGRTESFDTDIESYHGIEGGEAWAEGSGDRTVYLAAVPAGRYVLRLETQWPGNRTPPTLRVEMREGAFRLRYLFIALAVLLALPLIVGLRRFLFERRRWAESDHAWSTGGPDE